MAKGPVLGSLQRATARGAKWGGSINGFTDLTTLCRYLCVGCRLRGLLSGNQTDANLLDTFIEEIEIIHNTIQYKTPKSTSSFGDCLDV